MHHQVQYARMHQHVDQQLKLLACKTWRWQQNWWNAQGILTCSLFIVYYFVDKYVSEICTQALFPYGGSLTWSWDILPLICNLLEVQSCTSLFYLEISLIQRSSHHPDLKNTTVSNQKIDYEKPCEQGYSKVGSCLEYCQNIRYRMTQSLVLKHQRWNHICS